MSLPGSSDLWTTGRSSLSRKGEQFQTFPDPKLLHSSCDLDLGLYDGVCVWCVCVCTLRWHQVRLEEWLRPLSLLVMKVQITWLMMTLPR
jgi:hypothetical protein